MQVQITQILRTWRASSCKESGIVSLITYKRCPPDIGNVKMNAEDAKKNEVLTKCSPYPLSTWLSPKRVIVHAPEDIPVLGARRDGRCELSIVTAPDVDKNVVEFFKYTSLMIWGILSNNDASSSKIHAELGKRCVEAASRHADPCVLGFQ